MQTLLKLGYYLLALSVLVFGMLLVLIQTQVLSGYEVRIVQSGSMEPALTTGSVVLIREQASYLVGDIITYGDERSGSLPTTHRIVADQLQEGKIAFTTKGDANDSEDQSVTSLESVRGKVILDIPYLGYLLDFARQPLGFALLIGVPAGLIVFEEVGSIWSAVRNRKEDEIEKV